MKQIGNLAVVCARRQDVLLQVGSEKVCVHVGAGRSGIRFTQRGTMMTPFSVSFMN